MSHDHVHQNTSESDRNQRGSDLLAVDELCSKFRDHFVLLDQCKFSERYELTHGRVLRSSAERDEVYQALREHPNSVVVFTGDIDLEVEEPTFVELA